MTRNIRKLSLATVVSKVKHISEVQFEGKVYDNILAIFNQLTISEKRILLRGLIGICFTVEQSILDKHVETVLPNEEGKPSYTEQEVRAPRKEKGLKSWSMKLSIGIVLVFLLTTMFGSFFVTSENGFIVKLEHYVDMVKVAFGV